MENVKCIILESIDSTAIDDRRKDFDNMVNEYIKEMSRDFEKDERLFYPSKKSPVCVAVIGRKAEMAGFISLAFGSGAVPSLWTCHVYVKPECRRKGIYKQMMKRVDEFARSLNAKEIISVVFLENKKSLEAHEANGFAKEGYLLKKKI